VVAGTCPFKTSHRIMGFFRRQRSSPVDQREPAADERDQEEAAEVEDAASVEEDAELVAVDRSWRARAGEVIPGGTSTGSKRPEALYGDGNLDGPTHYVRASGCVVVTPSDMRLIDCTMALGSVAIGYGEESIIRAAMAAVASGNAGGLAHTSEVEIAERLVDLIPCAEQVRFLKSGAEAVSAAVRIARAATSRGRVVASGYFGWHDWSSSGRGVPEAAHADVERVPFDDVPALEAAVLRAGGELAAVVLEPVIERLPSDEWVAAARRLCDHAGAVLIFDEMKTGFRLRTAGYQEYGSVVPDLGVFGKAMANGFPIAAVVGRRAIMEAAEATWISSTLAGEAVGLAAVGAVLDLYEKDDVCGSLGSIGATMRESVAQAAAASGALGVEVAGLDPMWHIRFVEPAHERRFLELAVAEGVLFKRGPYNYAALAHGEEETLVEIERAASSAFVALREELSSSEADE
jgi:glutamate-1-semialdehyde 2,1-aminomutase